MYRSDGSFNFTFLFTRILIVIAAAATAGILGTALAYATR
jgi:hypothetical protein